MAAEQEKAERLKAIRKRIRKHTATDEQYEECFREHLPYEVNMLRGLYERLATTFSDQLTANAHIESFFLHARNLVDFFKNDTDCAFDPRYFTDAEYQPNHKFFPTDLRKRINHQISHLLAERKADANSKLGASDRTDVYKAIESEISRFENSLSEEFRQIWKVNRPHYTTIDAGSGTGASSQISY